MNNLDQGKVQTRAPQTAGAYGFGVTLRGEIDQIVQRVTDELKKEGFGVLTEIDVQATMKAKLNIDRRPYRILGACNPSLAHEVISAEPDIGLLLPCNVVVREEEDNSVRVSFMDPVAVLTLVNKPEVTKVGLDVRSRLERVRDRLSA